MNSTDCLTLVKLRLETYFCDFQNHEKATSGGAGEVKKNEKEARQQSTASSTDGGAIENGETGGH